MRTSTLRSGSALRRRCRSTRSGKTLAEEPRRCVDDVGDQSSVKFTRCCLRSQRDHRHDRLGQVDVVAGQPLVVALDLGQIAWRAKRHVVLGRASRQRGHRGQRSVIDGVSVRLAFRPSGNTTFHSPIGDRRHGPCLMRSRPNLRSRSWRGPLKNHRSTNPRSETVPNRC